VHTCRIYDYVLLEAVLASLDSLFSYLQTAESLRRRTIGWFGKLCDIFKAKVPMKLKRKGFDQ